MFHQCVREAGLYHREWWCESVSMMTARDFVLSQPVPFLFQGTQGEYAKRTHSAGQLDGSVGRWREGEVMGMEVEMDGDGYQERDEGSQIRSLGAGAVVSDWGLRVVTGWRAGNNGVYEVWKRTR